jgi:hypothetical protein
MITIEITQQFVKGDALEGITLTQRLTIDAARLDSWLNRVGVVLGGGWTGGKYKVLAIKQV